MVLGIIYQKNKDYFHFFIGGQGPGLPLAQDILRIHKFESFNIYFNEYFRLRFGLANALILE